VEAATIFVENSGTMDIADSVIIADSVTPPVVAVVEEEAEGEGEELQEGVHQEEVMVAVAVASQEEVKLPLEGSSQ